MSFKYKQCNTKFLLLLFYLIRLINIAGFNFLLKYSKYLYKLKPKLDKTFINKYIYISSCRFNKRNQF